MDTVRGEAANMLDVITLDEAISIIDGDSSESVVTEKVPLSLALGRILAEDVLSCEDLPAFSRSTVDGFAVRASDTFGCSEAIPAMLKLTGEIAMGEELKRSLKSGCCMRIPTGGQLPDCADACVMKEYVTEAGDGFVLVEKPAAFFENVNRRGDDCGKAEVIARAGRKLDAGTIALMAAVGVSEVKVVNKIRVGIISTGDELIPFCEKPAGSQIRDINSLMLKNLVIRSGGVPVNYEIVRDDYDELEKVILKASSECGAVLVSGGTSAGEKDNVSRVISSLGSLTFHGLALKPGKPAMYGKVGQTPVFGLPGHPMAAYFTYLLLAEPLIMKACGEQRVQNECSLVLSENVSSNHGREEILPVMIKGELAVPLHAKSGVICVVAKADGYLRIGRNTEGLSKGTAVKVIILNK